MTIKYLFFLVVIPLASCASYVKQDLDAGNLRDINGEYCNNAVNTETQLVSYLFYKKPQKEYDSDIVSIKIIERNQLEIKVLTGESKGERYVASGRVVDGQYYTDARLRFFSKWYGLVNGIGREHLRLSLLEDGNLQIKRYLYIVSGPLIIPLTFNIPTPVDNYVSAFKRCRLTNIG